NIESLRSELKFSTAELKNVVEAVGIRLARDSIQRAYSGGIKSSASRPTVQSEQVSAAFVSPITSLAEAVRRRMAGETIPKGAIDEFCRNILVEWDLPTKVVAIRTALEGDASTGGSPGLLSSWVELSTLKMGK